MPTIEERTAENIRQILHDRGIPERELAPVINRSQSAVSDRLNGRARFQLGEVVLVAAFLDVPVADLAPFEDVSA